MNISVLKFGGSSLATPQCVQQVAQIVADHYKKEKIVVVVSAEGKTTNVLLEKAKDFCPDDREIAALLSTGEQISASLLSMALQKLGLKAVSLLGWQIPIETTDNFLNADVISIQTDKIKSLLTQKNIVIVAGFQGVNKNGAITTLGRGGSDTTAVELARFLSAASCTLFSDVCGIYSADPHQIPEAKLRPLISYRQVQQLAEGGAVVVHGKAVSVAEKYHIPVQLKNTFNPMADGTTIGTTDCTEQIVSIATHAQTVTVVGTVSSETIQSVLTQNQILYCNVITGTNFISFETTNTMTAIQILHHTLC